MFETMMMRIMNDMGLSVWLWRDKYKMEFWKRNEKRGLVVVVFVLLGVVVALIDSIAN